MLCHTRFLRRNKYFFFYSDFFSFFLIFFIYMEDTLIYIKQFLRFTMESYSTKFKTAFLYISMEKFVWFLKGSILYDDLENGGSGHRDRLYDHCIHSTLRWDGLNRCDGIGIENNRWGWNVHHRNSGQTFVTWYQKSWGKGSRQCQVITLNFSTYIHLYCY